MPATDPDELDRIFIALAAGIAEARTVAVEEGIGPAFREIARHTRERHDLLREAVLEAEPHLQQGHAVASTPWTLP